MIPFLINRMDRCISPRAPRRLEHGAPVQCQASNAQPHTGHGRPWGRGRRLAPSLVPCPPSSPPPPLADCPFYNFKCQTASRPKVVVSPHASFRTGPDWYGKVRMCFLRLNLIFVVSPRPNTQKRAREKYGKSTEKYGKVRKPIVSSRRNGRTGTD